ncbi:L-serine ammonia-lyase, iron-sulfur-dependent, subunit alpha [Anaerococcus sp. Marseille-Q7828]|uniref:L-cysteine desulfidase family protein n=1 Tax=Anaerococcus sp. Marseille-Q7828 TaxID=3036300 RepID=UPI0024AD4909|nr:L-serine ammonia-lyase, iron-sulfur-dependent, subunit alpha [Anaerococcus sp. Marseille-Q7828]
MSMDKNLINKELIDIVKEDSTKAVGCTEPVAVAYAANVGAEYLDKSNIEKIEVLCSKNIFKNGKAVKIPNTGNHGLDLAASLGVFTEKTTSPLLVFSKLTDVTIKKAKDFVKDGKVTVNYIDNVPDVYVELSIFTGEDKVKVVLANSHSNIVKIIKNGEVIYDNPTDDGKGDKVSIKDMSFEELGQIVRDMDYDDIAFVLEGVEVNLNAANEGLEGYGLELGKKLKELKDAKILPDNFVTDTRILTAAAADMRMGGGALPIMTSGGSGNQGVGVVLPIYIVAKRENLDDESLARGLFFAHIINRYVKEYSGKLSGLCGCAIGAAIGASAGIAFMLDGSEEEIEGACTNVFANLTGIVCDGAKESCSMKLSTSAEESVIAAYLALNGVVTDANVGIVGDSIEETIINIGKLSHLGFAQTDKVMLDIIDR